MLLPLSTEDEAAIWLPPAALLSCTFTKPTDEELVTFMYHQLLVTVERRTILPPEAVPFSVNVSTVCVEPLVNVRFFPGVVQENVLKSVFPEIVDVPVPEKETVPDP